MKPAEELARFVQDGLRAGHSSAELKSAMAQAGWSSEQIDAALSGWADAGLRLPVPRPRAHVSAREAMIYGLLFVALLGLCWNLVTLGFALIEIWLGARAQGPFGGYLPRWSIATLIVVTPLFLALYLHIDRAHRAVAGQHGSVIRRWFGAVTFLLSALTLLGAAISVIYGLLSGDLTAQVMANTALVVTVATLVLLFFRDFMREG